MLQPGCASGPVVLVVMGVSAAGKSTVAAELARRLSLRPLDADNLHPARNRAKMASGEPLDDGDRWPWLDAVGAILAEAERGDGAVVACSALRRAYRDRLRDACPAVTFLHLDGSRAVLASRAASRQDHFMPASLLDSQLATLEPLGGDERGCRIDVGAGVVDIVDQAQKWVAANVG
jgi:gluconokinase